MAEIWKSKLTDKVSKGGKYRFENVQCFQYKGYEYIQWDCPTKVVEANGSKCEYTFFGIDDNYNDIVLVVSECVDPNSNNGWYLDFACVTRQCSQKNYFDLL